MKKILIVEDDEQIIDGLSDVLRGNGYETIAASDEQTTMEGVLEKAADLVIMDVNLGGENGFDICKAIRKKNDIPILFLTACDSEMELVRGFQAGGDDYITKPFRMQELLVRIQALLRRCSHNGGSIMKSGDVTFLEREYRLEKNGKPLDLTAIEMRMTTLLLTQWPGTIDREELYRRVWNSEYVDANTVNVNISRVREKLGDFHKKNYIETVRGIGYRWGIPVER